MERYHSITEAHEATPRPSLNRDSRRLLGQLTTGYDRFARNFPNIPEAVEDLQSTKTDLSQKDWPSTNRLVTITYLEMAILSSLVENAESLHHEVDKRSFFVYLDFAGGFHWATGVLRSIDSHTTNRRVFNDMVTQAVTTQHPDEIIHASEDYLKFLAHIGTYAKTLSEPGGETGFKALDMLVEEYKAKDENDPFFEFRNKEVFMAGLRAAQRAYKSVYSVAENLPDA